MRLIPLVALAVLPSAVAFVPLQPTRPSTRCTCHYSESDDDQHNRHENEDDPAFKYYNRQEDQDMVTQEMLWRDLLEDPKVSRKNKKGSFRTMDNRDSLPFVVKVMTPDPYTSPSEKKKQARMNTQEERNKKMAPKKTNLMGGIAASIFTKEHDGSLEKILGEFSLDKNTNCGDILEVGDKEYEVQKAKCQYKYAGGKRFVMVRKILEVKEVIRKAEEEYLLRQLQRSEKLSDGPPPLE